MFRRSIHKFAFFLSNNRSTDSAINIENGLENVNLVTIAKINNDTAGLVKELVISNQIDNTELANQIAKEIIADIESQVDRHLRKYQKYTLNAPNILSSTAESCNARDSDKDDSTAQFFNLISLLKDVSVLGRKLLELAPHFNAQKSTPGTSGSIAQCPGHGSNCDSKSIASGKSISSGGRNFNKIKDEDATSEDLLAALIESSSSDDFLVLSSSLESITIKDMILASLIYIKSHECFTLSHDIQGVVMVLRRTKFIIINILAPKNQVELITKLLTSIGRYNEMNYVFDLLRDRNQFEVLLSKGVEKTPELRIALFNYVKKNPEFYALVTLNFSMFREIAESLEASAVKRLNKLTASTKIKQSQRQQRKRTSIIPGSLSSSNLSSFGQSYQQQDQQRDLLESTMSDQVDSLTISEQSIGRRNLPVYSRDSLNMSLVELVDASDCYAKAGCYKKSNNCEKKAKLVALQLVLLTDGVNVLDIDQANLMDLITSFRVFGQAHIVANAYDYHIVWRQALFKNVILNGNLNYLEKFCEKCDLSSVLVEELVLLYNQHLNSRQFSQEESFAQAKSMERIIFKLDSVELKCKLYNQLNFERAKEELLLQDQAILAHLKDLKLA